ncbi:MAG: hypothetical protein IH991_03960 [Planctomycetes bacterium]|nr:hypothetical protein [Planctomycetota bacterium]
MATERPKRKRRWLRYSLRTFVLVLTVFGVWLGLLAQRHAGFGPIAASENEAGDNLAGRGAAGDDP